MDDQDCCDMLADLDWGFLSCEETQALNTPDLTHKLAINFVMENRGSQTSKELFAILLHQFIVPSETVFRLVKIPKIPFKQRLLGVAIFFYWMGIAYLFNGLASMFLTGAFMGGFSTPPAVWLRVNWFGMTWLPVLFLLGGLPTAIQALRGRDFRNTLLVSIGVTTKLPSTATLAHLSSGPAPA